MNKPKPYHYKIVWLFFNKDGTVSRGCVNKLEYGATDHKQGRSVAEWLGRQTWNPELTGSSSALTTELELFLGRP